eukprot:CAMPEP_0201873432 /NCGR_PEP_ID=MMETSP0902-20130614/5931_1 /ASSEMBLY_ACC=CAM_ASM_000551 /TAXON_ID=420261 /ORGANISM="Thalassiosira antarctica, Strain CCMP982" /LENGTH=682 /DNA_ID=CAMNT_0048400023 /DNA_START=29 /DNA_END=2077 /DNA_ORIENTATION=-
MTALNVKHPLEGYDSWNAHLSRQEPADLADQTASASPTQDQYLRRLSKAHKADKDDAGDEIDPIDDDDFDPIQLENLKYEEDLRLEKVQQKSDGKKQKKAEEKRKKRFKELYQNPGISKRSVHGLMIDAGSTGSRMHVYEFEPRVLASKWDVAAAVSGKKLSFPGTESRWTQRLRPGISDFADIEGDDELEEAIAKYLEPLISFAKSVLHTKESEFSKFPIFLKATAGLRTIPSQKRQRVISTVRKLFSNSTYCPFWDETERVRVISGEEEAVYGWAGVNFLLGNLMKNSEGAGEAYGGAIETYGALDMGGASAQISFYEPDGNVMSGLFKFQVGQGKHWNVYAHSHLMYGINMAETRRKARLVMNTTAKARLIDGVYDPCLPGGGNRSIKFKTRVHFDENGMETWDASVDDFATSSNTDDNGLYHAILVNDENTGDWSKCKALARDILNENSNSVCEFSHLGSCSFAGVYQPELPTQMASFGEFYAFSNYYHVWQFLQLQPRSSIEQLEQRGQHVCSQSWDQLVQYNKANPNITLSEDALASYCFHAAYAHEILRHGYGFQPSDHIIAADVVNGQKVTWALGSILYEINTLPWDYVEVHGRHHIDEKRKEDMFAEWGGDFSRFVVCVVLVALLGSLQIIRLYQRRSKRSRKDGYEAVTDANDIEIENLARSCPNFQAQQDI